MVAAGKDIDVHVQLCKTLAEQERYVDAEVLCHDILLRLHNNCHHNNANTHTHTHTHTTNESHKVNVWKCLGVCLAGQERYKEAEVAIRSELEYLRDVLGLDVAHVAVRSSMRLLAWCLLKQGRADEADALARQVLPYESGNEDRCQTAGMLKA
jgi:hypothetical protein